MTDFDTYETYDSAIEKIMSFTHNKSKTATLLQKYMIALLNMKFSRYYCSRDVNIGQDKRKRWQYLAEKINDFIPIVPIIDKKPDVKTLGQLIPKDNVISKFRNDIYQDLEKWKNNLKKAEQQREIEIKEQRKLNKINRQKIIDYENKRIAEKFEEDKKERQKEIDKLLNNDIHLVRVSSEECLPNRAHPDIDYKMLDPKLKFIGYYSNNSRRTIKHVKNPTNTENLFKFEYDILSYSTIENREAIFVPGNIKTYYFEKNLKLGVNAINQKVKLPEVENPKYLPDAITEKTSQFGGSLDSDLDIKPWTIIKRPRPITQAMTQANNSIKSCDKDFKELAKQSARVYENINKGKQFTYNKFSVLKVHKAAWNLDKYVKNDDKITMVDCGLKNDVKSDRIYDKVVDVRPFKNGVEMTKRQINLRKNQMKEVKRKHEKLKIVDVEKRISLREMIMNIVNSKILEETKIPDKKLLDSKDIDYYLETGSLSKKVSGLHKSARQVVLRILRSFYLELFE